MLGSLTSVVYALILWRKAREPTSHPPSAPDTSAALDLLGHKAPGFPINQLCALEQGQLVPQSGLNAELSLTLGPSQTGRLTSSPGNGYRLYPQVWRTQPPKSKQSPSGPCLLFSGSSYEVQPPVFHFRGNIPHSISSCPLIADWRPENEGAQGVLFAGISLWTRSGVQRGLCVRDKGRATSPTFPT